MTPGSSTHDGWDEILQRREVEEAAEHARLAAQKARTDITPLDPARGEWTVELHWREPLHEYAPNPTYTTHPDRGWAHREGLQASCWAGVTAVRVIAPDGQVVESYDRQGNFWLCHDGDVAG